MDYNKRKKGGKVKVKTLKDMFTSKCKANNMIEEIPSDEDVDIEDSDDDNSSKKSKPKLPKKTSALKFTNSNSQFKGNSRVFYTCSNEGETKTLKIGVLKDNSIYWVAVTSQLGIKIWYSEIGDEVSKKIDELNSEFAIEYDVLQDIKTTIINIAKRKEYSRGM